ncbi:Ribonuclease P protein subunit P38-related isoform 2 [Tripterygium wilfordii]|uniref:Ribonuclease P protein subunit P38-related isoform 2 n=1 Tax=Tripterygium wilfordii TaxID=458696 RepID=A0A7J7CAV5_TRIWF|nr:golgin subfamily A member 6-like protein 22 [Tripterygium wilfordii]XP_038685143.1 golgin subfamily A member 6-like protein 22 [Tripterygium wilfordii]XP_038685145.1 golgin subfamily A member 6-like protein 22 [Tripterygium wilfordii]KAF5731263.1 Ribonuclease P protein subunit P38-related isoform 2 [Tripterygium wilfordii]
MDEKGVVSGSYAVVSNEKSDSLYPMCFGVSCAFFALRLLSRHDAEDEKWSELCDKMLQGSAQLLGLLLWRVQKEEANEGNCKLIHRLKTFEKEIAELKKMRHEDAKANEKVVGIFACQEQSWLSERKKLRQHIGALINELRILEKKKVEAMNESNEKLKEMEAVLQSKDKLLEEEEQKRKELEENLSKAESVAEEMSETAKCQAQEHSTEIRKHKTAFIELVSNHRQLEAELGRAHRQVEVARQELNLVLEQKEESVLLAQKLSMELVKMRNELEQKDNILSAMLRKSKLDTAEKQMLLKEVKSLKAKKKQTELDTERWKTVSESRQKRHSLRSMFANQASSRLDDKGTRGASHFGKSRSQQVDYVIEYEHHEVRKDPESFSSLYDHYSSVGKDELAGASVKQLEGWVRLEAEKYATAIDKKHHLEIDAFVEQMRLKDGKLEDFRWRFVGMEIESKKLQSLVEGLNHDVLRLRRDNKKLDALLLEREEELNSLKQQFASQLEPQSCQKPKLNAFLNDPGLVHDAIWSKVKIVRRKSMEINHETETSLPTISPERVNEKEEEIPSNHPENLPSTLQSPERGSEEEMGAGNGMHTREESMSSVEVDKVEESSSSSNPLTKNGNSPLSMDLRALGVSYKIKRLKQQLLMLERVIGKQGSEKGIESSDNGQCEIKGFQVLMSLVNKQINRYQSLQGKTDDLCKRMHENELDTSQAGSTTSKNKGKFKTLEHILEETFQLQRYMVATGQKLMEILPKIASEFVGIAEEIDKPASFDMKRFADSVRTLLQEVQRGLEVRISRIIGDLEGTLACEGMIHMRRR